MGTVRAGILGLGVMGANHARVLPTIDGVDVVAVHDPALDVSTYGGIPVVDSPEGLFDTGLDCCVIAAPTEHHYAMSRLAADRGVAVLVEKPLAGDHDDAAEMAGWFADQGLVAVVGHVERFNPAAIELHRRLSAGQLGPLYQLTTRRQGPFPTRIRDVGVILDMATHDIDLTQWVTASHYTTFNAWTAHKSGRDHEDLVIATGRLDNGVIVSHHVNWLSSRKERLTIATGEGGTLIADTLNVDLYFHENAAVFNEWPAAELFRGVGEGNMTKYALTRTEPLRNELEAFIAAVRGEAEPAVSFEQGARVVQVAEAMQDSAPDGRLVTLDAI